MIDIFCRLMQKDELVGYGFNVTYNPTSYSAFRNYVIKYNLNDVESEDAKRYEANYLSDFLKIKCIHGGADLGKTIKGLRERYVLSKEQSVFKLQAPLYLNLEDTSELIRRCENKNILIMNNCISLKPFKDFLWNLNTNDYVDTDNFDLIKDYLPNFTVTEKDYGFLELDRTYSSLVLSKFCNTGINLLKVSILSKPDLVFIKQFFKEEHLYFLSKYQNLNYEILKWLLYCKKHEIYHHNIALYQKLYRKRNYNLIIKYIKNYSNIMEDYDWWALIKGISGSIDLNKSFLIP